MLSGSQKHASIRKNNPQKRNENDFCSGKTRTLKNLACFRTNIGRDSLNHAEVISITSSFLTDKPLMQKILIKKFPILLIDESQDTKKELMDAFLIIQDFYNQQFSLGLFGDTMQRIYTDGKTDIGSNLPIAWAKPAKLINYRCPQRIITLINKIRSAVDNHIQNPSDRNEEGTVRFFIVDTNKITDKLAIENSVMDQMFGFTNDDDWKASEAKVKILTLEHHMAARRSGFLDLFEALYSIEKYRTRLLDGTLPGISFFLQQIIPLVSAKQEDNSFAITQIVRKYSPILEKKNLKDSKTPIDEIKKTQLAVNEVYCLFNSPEAPLLLQVLQKIASSGLFTIPEVFYPILKRNPAETTPIENDDSDKEETIDAWNKALKCSFNQIKAYSEYISDKSRFGTHQGVKGLEFPRVMVILDDEEARGFMFSYDKLFGAKSLSDTDKKNIKEGKETSIDRTRRLFYVTCSRAEKSLAIVAYAKNPDSVRNHTINNGWFSESEVVRL